MSKHFHSNYYECLLPENEAFHGHRLAIGLLQGLAGQPEIHVVNCHFNPVIWVWGLENQVGKVIMITGTGNVMLVESYSCSPHNEIVIHISFKLDKYMKTDRWDNSMITFSWFLFLFRLFPKEKVFKKYKGVSEYFLHNVLISNFRKKKITHLIQSLQIKLEYQYYHFNSLWKDAHCERELTR